MNDPGNEMWNDWQKMAQQSWQTWSDMARAGGHGAPAPAPAGYSSDATVQRMIDGLKTWQQWMQTAAGTNLSSQDWQQNLQAMFGRGGQPFMQAFNGIDSAGAHGFEHMMQQWMSAQQPTAGVREMLGMPAFGFNREHQQQQQQLMLAMLDYADRTRRYNELISQANLQGVQRMQARLQERAEADKPVESLRGLYDLWVDVAEEAYAEVAMSPDFRVAYGDMVNAQMHMRSLQQKQVEQASAQLGMPTRSEVDSIGKRLQEVRRELRSVDVPALVAEVEALRAEVAALRRAGATAAKTTPGKKSSTAPAKKKAAPAKKNTARKSAAAPKRASVKRKPATTPARKR